MKIVVIDKNVDRHKWHREFWDTEYPDYNIDIVKSLSREEVSSLTCDAAIIHYNNSESTYFEENENIDYIKIFFSGGTTSIKEYPEENEYYVPQAHLPSFIKNKLNGLVGI